MDFDGISWHLSHALKSITIKKHEFFDAVESFQFASLKPRIE
jgi:hypothetical protein